MKQDKENKNVWRNVIMLGRSGKKVISAQRSVVSEEANQEVMQRP